MSRILFISLFFSLAVSTVFAQLRTNPKSINVGQVDKRANCQIQIPILNQSHEGLTFSAISGNNQGLISLPDSLNSYEQNQFMISANYLSSNKKFSHKISFASSQGKVVINIKGRFVNNSGSQECYNFDKKQVKVKTCGKYISGTKLTPLIRIFSTENS